MESSFIFPYHSIIRHKTRESICSNSDLCRLEMIENYSLSPSESNILSPIENFSVNRWATFSKTSGLE